MDALPKLFKQSGFREGAQATWLVLRRSVWWGVTGSLARIRCRHKVRVLCSAVFSNCVQVNFKTGKDKGATRDRMKRKRGGDRVGKLRGSVNSGGPSTRKASTAVGRATCRQPSDAQYVFRRNAAMRVLEWFEQLEGGYMWVRAQCTVEGGTPQGVPTSAEWTQRWVHGASQNVHCVAGDRPWAEVRHELEMRWLYDKSSRRSKSVCSYIEARVFQSEPRPPNYDVAELRPLYDDSTVHAGAFLVLWIRPVHPRRGLRAVWIPQEKRAGVRCCDPEAANAFEHAMAEYKRTHRDLSRRARDRLSRARTRKEAAWRCEYNTRFETPQQGAHDPAPDAVPNLFRGAGVPRSWTMCLSQCVASSDAERTQGLCDVESSDSESELCGVKEAPDTHPSTRLFFLQQSAGAHLPHQPRKTNRGDLWRPTLCPASCPALPGPDRSPRSEQPLSITS